VVVCFDSNHGCHVAVTRDPNRQLAARREVPQRWSDTACENHARRSCVQFVSYCYEQAGRKEAASLVREAWDMWKDDRWLAPVDTPEPGDLAFFARPGEAAVGHPTTGPAGSPEQWHVMLLSGPRTVIGACPMLDRVCEADLEYYLAVRDGHGNRWDFRGYRRPSWLASGA
jgi:hypothetical protein